ncbi:hypothetical protein P4O66_002122 [Electrophorus voltai]|uniref:Uncharacterized protein n=1 Tax=Electrophorus voltai TaxID=2609070 RepID=A0AAD8Z139_9TELE|nr:hypothetical protein P4O66_002122 [Electrophorus voltai]
MPPCSSEAPSADGKSPRLFLPSDHRGPPQMCISCKQIRGRRPSSPAPGRDKRLHKNAPGRLEGETIVDYSRPPGVVTPATVGRVSSITFLGVHLFHDPAWSLPVTAQETWMTP